MSNDTPPVLPRRKLSITRYLLLGSFIVGLIVAFLALRPDPKIIISQDTTYVTQPLRSDGLPDYEQFEWQRQRGAIRADENAAVLLWQALWPGELSPADYSSYCQELGLESVPDSSQSLERLYSASQRADLVAWLSRNGYPDVVDDFADEVTNAALSAPWTSRTIPPLAAWVERNRTPLDTIVAASRRSKYYSPSPSFLNEKDDALIDVWIPGVSNEYAAVRALLVRAMWHAGEGRQTESCEDISAALRLTQAFSNGHCLVEKMAAFKTTNLALAATINLLQFGEIDLANAVRIRDELDTIRINFDLAKCFQYCDRLMFLDSVLLHARAKSSETMDRDQIFQRANLVDVVSIDWNIALREGNDWYDRIVTAVSLPTYFERQQAIDTINSDLKQLEGERDRHNHWMLVLSRDIRSKVIASIHVCLLLPAVELAVAEADQTRTRLQLTQLAAALAVYRAEHGQYPDQLAQLVPGTIAALPVDLYHAKPFIYQRDAEGYLLYSTGPNGIDDGGSNEQRSIFQGQELPERDEAAAEKLRQKIPTGADDLSIRLPTPPFQLPSPPK